MAKFKPNAEFFKKNAPWMAIAAFAVGFAVFVGSHHSGKPEETPNASPTAGPAPNMTGSLLARVICQDEFMYYEGPVVVDSTWSDATESGDISFGCERNDQVSPPVSLDIVSSAERGTGKYGPLSPAALFEISYEFQPDQTPQVQVVLPDGSDGRQFPRVELENIISIPNAIQTN